MGLADAWTLPTPSQRESYFENSFLQREPLPLPHGMGWGHLTPATPGTGCGKDKREMGKDVTGSREFRNHTGCDPLSGSQASPSSNSGQGWQTPHGQASSAPALGHISNPRGGGLGCVTRVDQV